MKLIDSHCHLDFIREAPQAVLGRAAKAGVHLIVNPGASLDSSRAAVALAERFEEVYATVGVHPHDAKDLDDQVLRELRALAQHPKVIAIGEVGLDYYRNLSPRDVQRRAFERQLELAAELGLPVVVHDRDAHEHVMSALRRWVSGGERRGVLHAFSGDVTLARKATRLGFYLGIAGPVTFKNAGRLHEVVRQVDLDWLLVETDAPYMTPEPYRGKRNEPAYVRFTAEAIARLRGEDVETVARRTTQNVHRLFARIKQSR